MLPMGESAERRSFEARSRGPVSSEEARVFAVRGEWNANDVDGDGSAVARDAEKVGGVGNEKARSGDDVRERDQRVRDENRVFGELCETVRVED